MRQCECSVFTGICGKRAVATIRIGTTGRETLVCQRHLTSLQAIASNLRRRATVILLDAVEQKAPTAP